MKRFISVLVLLLAVAVPVFSQSEESAEEELFVYKYNQAGDQYLQISLNGDMPLNFPDVPSLFTKDEWKMFFGGLGSIEYSYFLTDTVSVGGSAGFGFNSTAGGHIFNFVPVAAKITWHPVAGRFEFPLSLEAGFSAHSYSNFKYLGIFLKPSFTVFFRLNPSWSIGGQLSYMFMPEFCKLYNPKSENILGQFLNFGLSLRYHF